MAPAYAPLDKAPGLRRAVKTLSGCWYLALRDLHCARLDDPLMTRRQLILLTDAVAVHPV
jgi:hypothetical protein